MAEPLVVQLVGPPEPRGWSAGSQEGISPMMGKHQSDSRENGNNGPISKPVSDTHLVFPGLYNLAYAAVSSSELKIQGGTSGIPESWESGIPEGGVVVFPRLILVRRVCSSRKMTASIKILQ